MKKDIYKITIKNWEKYNGQLKPTHKKIMLATNFLNDAKIRSCTPVTRLLYLSCLLLAGESAQSQIEVSHESLVFQSGVKSQSLQSQLNQLQSLQLLTWEKNETLIKSERKDTNVSKKKRNEKKGILPEMSGSDLEDSKKTLSKHALETFSKNENRKVFDAYFNAYRLRYGVDVHKNAEINSQIARFRSKFGTEESIRIIEFYLKHNDSWYIKHTHSFVWCYKQADTLRTQMHRNQPITSTMVRSFEKSQSTQQTLDAIKNGALDVEQ